MRYIIVVLLLAGCASTEPYVYKPSSYIVNRDQILYDRYHSPRAVKAYKSKK